MIQILIAVVISYLLGSIPTAYLFGRLYKNIDIRQHGSGNIGATNAFRVLGKVPGTVVLLLDIIKGILPITLVGDYFHVTGILPRLLLGLTVVCGHNWTIFLNFKGGKGIATSLGVLIGLTIQFPSLGPVLLVCVLSWVILFLIFGYVSLASLVAAIALPASMILFKQPLEFVILGLIFSIFIIIRHKTNISRLLSHTEPKVNFPFKRQ